MQTKTSSLVVGFIALAILCIALLLGPMRFHGSWEVALTAVAGIVAAGVTLLITERSLRSTHESLVEANEHLSAGLGRIEEQEKRLENDIINLEDATRRNLNGFADIFARSLWLLEQAEREIIYVNFVVNFGVAHQENINIKREYVDKIKELKLPNGQSLPADFPEACTRFWEILNGKIGLPEVTRVKLVTLSDTASKNSFIDKLAGREGYEYLREGTEFQTDLERYEKAHRSSLLLTLNAHCGVASHQGETGDDQMPRGLFGHTKKKELQWMMGDRIPLQLLIAGLPMTPSRSTADRYGCIVFLLGTEGIAGLRNGEREEGFYTELEGLVRMFRNFVDNISEPMDKMFPGISLVKAS